MNYEIHITVENNGLFEEDCKRIGVKPIIIETENKDVRKDKQVMTSSKHSGFGAEWYSMAAIKTLGLMEMGYKIVRVKVEIQPDPQININHVYYESHIRLRLPKHFGKIEKLKEFCLSAGWHWSKNLFKKSEQFDYQMMTFRYHSKNLDEFSNRISRMKDKLTEDGVDYDKVEIEECILDTFEQRDKEWLNK